MDCGGGSVGMVDVCTVPAPDHTTLSEIADLSVACLLASFFSVQPPLLSQEEVANIDLILILCKTHYCLLFIHFIPCLDADDAHNYYYNIQCKKTNLKYAFQ